MVQLYIQEPTWLKTKKQVNKSILNIWQLNKETVKQNFLQLEERLCIDI